MILYIKGWRCEQPGLLVNSDVDVETTHHMSNASPSNEELTACRLVQLSITRLTPSGIHVLVMNHIDQSCISLDDDLMY